MKLLFAGTPAFAAAYLRALTATDHQIVGVITQPDKPGKRGKKPVASPVKQAAESLQLQVLQPQRLTRADIADYDADLMIVVAYGQILNKEVLSFPKYGCFNVHGSLLPRWRGAAPIQRAILAGDTQTGICIMQMDEGLDTGNVLASVAVTIAATDTAGMLFDKLEQAGIPCLLNTLSALPQSQDAAVTQPDSGVTYAKKLRKEEAQINWFLPADVINRTIRGFNPEPIAYTFLGDLRVKVWSAKPLDLPGDNSAEPGTIIQLTSEGVTVTCESGQLLITQLQLPLGKGSILTGKDMVNSRKDLLAPGGRFNGR